MFMTRTWGQSSSSLALTFSGGGHQRNSRIAGVAGLGLCALPCTPVTALSEIGVKVAVRNCRSLLGVLVSPGNLGLKQVPKVKCNKVILVFACVSVRL